MTFAGGIVAPTPSPTPNFGPLPGSPVNGSITGFDGMCIDDNGRMTANGNAIQVFGCNGTPAQAWTIQPDATLQVLGKCMGVTKPAPSGQTVIWDCDGDATQQWRQGPANSLVNMASGLCLEDPNANSQWGTQLDIAPCTGAADQAWTLPR
jgi:Ricin-type beta-trefoil lectin domain